MRIRLWFLMALVLGLWSVAQAQNTPAVQATPTIAVSPLPAVTLPETDTIGSGTSICEQNRKQSIGETSSLSPYGSPACFESPRGPSCFSAPASSGFSGPLPPGHNHAHSANSSLRNARHLEVPQPRRSMSMDMSG